MLIANVSQPDQCEIPAVPRPALAVMLCVRASLMWKVKFIDLKRKKKAE